MERPDVLVQDLVTSSGLAASNVARRAGVSPSTLHRIVHGQVDPSFGTLREVAIACDLGLSLVTHRLSDPRAAAAARWMLEVGYEPPKDPEVTAWMERLPRLAGGGDPVEIVRVAARASSPMHRPGASLYAGDVAVARVASAGDASRGQWAVSGAPGLDLPLETDPTPRATILWCEDVRTVDHLLAGSGLRSTNRTDHATLAVVQGEPELFIGSFTHGIVRYAAPIQIVLDCLSAGGHVADRALEEVRSW